MYRDPNLWLDRPAILPTHKSLGAAVISGYDRVFDFNGNRMFVMSRREPVRRPELSYPPPAIIKVQIHKPTAAIRSYGSALILCYYGSDTHE
jgi:hypothetical protein